MHAIVRYGRRPRSEVLVALGMAIVRRLAARIARRVPPSVAIDDLVAAGAEGLLRALDAYDPSRAQRFDAYVEARVRGAILDELRAGDTLTRHARRTMSAIARATRDLHARLGRMPTDEEVAAALGIDADDHRRRRAELERGAGMSRAGEIDPDELESPERDAHALYEERELREMLRGAIAQLPLRTRRILDLYYHDERTQAEIGKMMGVTESRVCQILGGAAIQLRRALDRAHRAAPRRAGTPRTARAVSCS